MNRLGGGRTSGTQAIVTEVRLLLPTQLRSRLENPLDPIYTGSSLPGESTQNPAGQLRNQLAPELGREIAIRWGRKDEADGRHWSQPFFWRELQEAGDIGWAAVATVSDFFSGIINAGGLVIEIAWNSAKTIITLQQQASQLIVKAIEGDTDGLRTRLESIGVNFNHQLNMAQQFQARSSAAGITSTPCSAIHSHANCCGMFNLLICKNMLPS